MLAANLFPAVEAIQPDRLPADVRRMLKARQARIKACGKETKCLVTAARWTDQESAALAAAAASAAAAEYTAPDDGVQGEVARQLQGLNAILDVYAGGSPPRYPAIDGPGEAAATAPSATNLSYAIDLATASAQDPVVRLDPSLGLALALLDAHDRDQAAAYEPLDKEYNAAALGKARGLDWRRWRFTAIIVPGVGPDDLVTPLSARGKLNVRMAAERYADGVAPFIIVSGSAVHPRGTHFVEALEMRRALIERFGVPSAAIVVDPYARHTTTNLRNVTRRLVALGAPLDRDAVIITNVEQSAYIESAVFADRNRQELGYQPGNVGSRLSPNELTFRPSRSSLRVDPTDPLDP